MYKTSSEPGKMMYGPDSSVITSTLDLLHPPLVKNTLNGLLSNNPSNSDSPDFKWSKKSLKNKQDLSFKVHVMKKNQNQSFKTLKMLEIFNPSTKDKSSSMMPLPMDVLSQKNTKKKDISKG